MREISQETLETVMSLVKPQYDSLNCWVHSWPHVERVSRNVAEIAKLEKVNPNPPLVSAYCHDLGRIEEEQRRIRGETALPHALLSIEPTVKVLTQSGISGVDFDEIVEAVTVHSYRVYEGRNVVAQILQDGDKMNGFGPYGIIGAVKYFGGIDIVDPSEIQANRDNREVLEKLSELSLAGISGDVLSKVARGLSFVLEWFQMLHTKSARELIREEYEYTKRVEESLRSKIKKIKKSCKS